MFLRQNLETKLAGLCVPNPAPPFVLPPRWTVADGFLFPNRQIEAKQYRDALALIEGLLKEVKRLDDKLILTEVHLLESRANGETANWPKAKVRPPPHSLCGLQEDADDCFVRAGLFDGGTDGGQLDLLPAVTAGAARHAERHPARGGQGLQDCVRAFPSHRFRLGSSVLTPLASRPASNSRYSYFFETFEGYTGADDARSLKALKYMLLCKVMMSQVRPRPLDAARVRSSGIQRLTRMLACLPPRSRKTSRRSSWPRPASSSRATRRSRR